MRSERKHNLMVGHLPRVGFRELSRMCNHIRSSMHTMRQAALCTLTRAGVRVINPAGIVEDILGPPNGQLDKGSHVGDIIGTHTGRASRGGGSHYP